MTFRRNGGRVLRRLGQVNVPATQRLLLGDLATRVLHQVRRDHIRAHAGHLAFRGLFSIFAAFVLALMLLALFEARGMIEEALNQLGPGLPDPVIDAVRNQILATTMRSTTASVGLGTAASVVAALYGLSATARAVMDALNNIYGVEERRRFLPRVLVSLVLTAGVIVLLIVSFLLLVLGPQIAQIADDAFDLGAAVETMLNVLRWPALLFLVTLGVALTYTHAPAVAVPFRLVTHGTVVSLAGWFVFTVIFSLYVEHLGSFNATYGALAGVAVLLLYMYFSAVFVLVGAEIDDVVASHLRHEEAAGVAWAAPHDDRVE